MTFADQLVLSGLQFAVGLSFIYFGTPEEYGKFSFLLVLLTLFGSVQNALVNTPLVVLSARITKQKREDFERGLCGVLFFIILVCMVSVISWFSIQNMLALNSKLSLVEAIVFLVFLGPLMLREFWRADEFAKLAPERALRRDVLYCLISAAILLLLLSYQTVLATTCFAAMGIGSFAVILRPTIVLSLPAPEWNVVVRAFKKAWPHSKWSLLGAVSSWLQLQSYVLVPFYMIGTKEVAMLSAARLVMQPPALLSSSWSNYLRPLTSRLLHQGDIQEVRKIFQKSIAINITALMLYTGMIIFLFRISPANLIPDAYQGIGKYILLWGMVICIAIVRDSISAIMQSALAFRPLGMKSLASSLFTCCFTVIMVFTVGGSGALIARIAGDFLLLLMLAIGFGRQLQSSELQSKESL